MTYNMRAQNGSATPEHPLSQRHRNQSQNVAAAGGYTPGLWTELWPRAAPGGEGFLSLGLFPLGSMATATIQNQLDREVGVCSDGTRCMGNLLMEYAEPALPTAQMRPRAVVHSQLLHS